MDGMKRRLTRAARRCSLLASAALMLAAIPASTAGAASSYTIETSRGFVARIGAFHPSRNPTIAAAQRVFGAPSSRKLTSDNSCLVEWRRLRLRITFANFGGHGPGQTTCSSSVGRAQSFTARGSRMRTWEGLRVGARSSTITERHHSAEFREGGWWLRTAVSPFGDESEYAVVSALVSQGRVNVLVGWIGAAGE
jgi:hypothetical protein